MTSLADRTITALRSTHDELAPLVAGLTEEQLRATSGASEWTVAQVLSHLGSGAEITQAGLRAAVDGTEVEPDFNQSVWDRWDALGVQEQADGFSSYDERLVAALEALTPEQRETLEVKLGFLPAPLSVASFAGMRLNEAAQHSWDVRVAFEPTATLDASAADVLVEHFAGGLGFLLGFTGKPDALPEAARPARVELENDEVTIVIEDEVSISTSPTDATAAFSGGPEALIRLIGGRLTAPYTPEGVDATGNVTLDDLRAVFPGY